MNSEKELKHEIVRICGELQPPFTQIVFDFIRKELGEVMIFGDDSEFFVKFDNGVGIDLDEQIFEEHIEDIHEFVIKMSEFITKNYESGKSSNKMPQTTHEYTNFLKQFEHGNNV